MAPRERKSVKKAENEKKDQSTSKKDSKDSSKKSQVQSNDDIKRDDQPFRLTWKKIATRFALSMLMIFMVYWTSRKEESMIVFASQKQTHQLITDVVSCSPEYKKDVSRFKGCAPNQCGRLVSDIVVSPEEAAHLLRLSQKGLAFGGSNGGASILDLHSGALSNGDSFINIYEKLKAHSDVDILTAEDFKVYKNVRNKIQQMISYNFGVPVNKLYLTHPTFFSEMTTRTPKTKHDEYWHVHIDKETYPSFHYTALLYLTDYGTDFTGGRFVFVDKKKNITVEPRTGRVSAFTSGAENPHYVERVSSGTRYALTVAFTCDPKLAIQDPSTQRFK